MPDKLFRCHHCGALNDVGGEKREDWPRGMVGIMTLCGVLFGLSAIIWLIGLLFR